MKLAQWARENGVGYSTAREWFRTGSMPHPTRKLPSGTIWVDVPHREPAPVAAGVALYARVSSADQRADLERQLGRLAVYAAGNSLAVTRTVSEVGSAMNGSRPSLRRLLADPTVGTIVVEHRDRLARFGVEYLEAALSAHGRKLVVVVDDTELDDDLVRDMTEVLTSFCARLYGRRSARRRAEAATNAAAAASLGGEA